MEMFAVRQEQGLTTSSSSSHTVSSRQVPFQERAFSLGDIIGVNAYRINRDALKQRLVEGGYQVHTTPHFLVCQQPGAPTIVVHWFPPAAIDGDLGHHFLEELKPFGILAVLRGFSDVFGAVVNSVVPQDPQRAWHLFGTNTLKRYHQLIGAGNPSPHYEFPVEVFAALYRRVCELHIGTSLLDAGCSFGFLPLVIAERAPALTKVVGVDIHAEPFPVTRAIAEERHLKQVQFVQADLLSDEVSTLGSFDVVTALHVLEHFTETEMYRVLKNLVKITSRRLILAVPYEPDTPEAAYGHEQLFTREKLEAVGQWCIEQWGGGQVQYENCVGGLLYLDRGAA
jgi:methyltransferase family protein